MGDLIVRNDDKKYSIINNAKSIEYKTNGTFGVIFILEMNDNANFPYNYTTNQTAPIKKVLLKLVGICSPENIDTKQYVYNTQTLTEDALILENDVQNQVYNCGMENGLQLCPKIYKFEVIENEKIQYTLNRLKKLTGYEEKPQYSIFPFSKKTPPPTYTVLNELINAINNMDKLALIAMEFAESYEPANNENNENDKNIIRVTILYLALVCKLAHNDPVYNDFLIDRKTGHGMFIDFGSSIDNTIDNYKITDEEHSEIKEYIKKKDYRSALNKCNKSYNFFIENL